jgi:hypothetical protein
MQMEQMKYVAGSSNGGATLWKNGVAQSLGTSMSEAWSVFVVP